MWIGTFHGDKAVRCAPPIREEPSHGGLPLVVSCRAAVEAAAADSAKAMQAAPKFDHISIFSAASDDGASDGEGGSSNQEAGEEDSGGRMFISEVVPYAASPWPLSLPPEANLGGGDTDGDSIADGINARYERGEPSNILEEGGVLVHIFGKWRKRTLNHTLSHTLSHALPHTPSRTLYGTPSHALTRSHTLSRTFPHMLYIHDSLSCMCDSRPVLPRTDSYEDEIMPWMICHVDCRHGPVDSCSASLISRTMPVLPLHLGSVSGFIIAPDAQLLCAFPSDAGSGGHVNGRCEASDRAAVGTGRDSGGAGCAKQASGEVTCSRGFTGNTLKEALTQQYDGSWRRAHRRSAEYNEIVLGGLYWEGNLPWFVEAFVYVGTQPPGQLEADVLSQMRAVRASFLAYYGLGDEHAPLLRYVCSQWSLVWDPTIQRNVPTAPTGECFEQM